MTLYQILEVEVTATADEIKLAYRRKVKAHHPDIAGGDREKFQAVQRAYDILSDAVKRAAYDRDGDEGNVTLPTPSGILAEAFVAALEIVGNLDPVTATRLVLEERLSQERARRKKHELEAKRWREVLQRIERKGGEPILESVLERRIEPHLRAAEEARAWIEGITLALQLITQYRYRDDAANEFFRLGEALHGSIGKGKPQRRRKAA